MTKKVLGFKGEDIFIFEKKGRKHILVERIGDETIQGNIAFELVSVVSLKWLKKWCGENANPCMKCGSVTCAICQKDLLSAMRKEIRKT